MNVTNGYTINYNWRSDPSKLYSKWPKWPLRAFGPIHEMAIGYIGIKRTRAAG